MRVKIIKLIFKLLKIDILDFAEKQLQEIVDREKEKLNKEVLELNKALCDGDSCYKK